VGADGSMTFPEMIRMLGNRSLALPFGILYALNNLAWLLRLTAVSEFPSPALNMVRYPWIVSSEKLKNELGYRYRYTTQETFQDFAQAYKRSKKET
jgi:nucleoside-diphosphate-sugar epimerase